MPFAGYSGLLVILIEGELPGRAGSTASRDLLVMLIEGGGI